MNLFYSLRILAYLGGAEFELKAGASLSFHPRSFYPTKNVVRRQAAGQQGQKGRPVHCHGRRCVLFSRLKEVLTRGKVLRALDAPRL
jgi:hypothetical protein